MAEGVNLGFKLDDARVRQLLQRAPESIQVRLRQLVEGGAIDTQREMRVQAPVGVGGGAGLRGSVRYTYSAPQLRAVVEPVAPYADDVQEGRGPRWVSVAEGSPLLAWAKLKGLNPYAVQKAIAKRGTKANPFVTRTYNVMQPRVQASFVAGVDELIRSLDNGDL